MVYVRLLRIIVKIPTNKISLTGFKKTGSNAVVSMAQMIGIIIIISIVHHCRSAAEKHVAYHFHAAKDNRTRLYEINSVDTMCAENQM